MGLFAKSTISILCDLLEQVHGGVYVFKTRFDKKNKKIFVAYGTGAHTPKELTPFAGISTYTKTIDTYFLKPSKEMQTLSIRGKAFQVPQNVFQLFWEMISELTSELESRARKILLPIGEWGFVVKNVDIINPFEIDNTRVLLRVEIVCGERFFQEDLPAYQIFYLGTKRILQYVLLQMINYYASHFITIEAKQYIEVLPKAVSGSIPKFLQAISDIDVMDVLLEDENAIRSRLTELQKRFLNNIKKQDVQLGLEPTYLLQEGQKEFKIAGLELAYVIFILLGTPNRMPLPLLLWLLDDLADTVIKERLLELPIEFFFGDEEALFKGLVEDSSEEDLLKNIDLGMSSNLTELKVSDELKKFKIDMQRSLLKFDFGQEKERLRKLANTKRKNTKVKQEAKVKPQKKVFSLKPFTLFIAFDEAEKELRLREITKEITLYIVSGLNEEIDSEKFLSVSQNVFNIIRNMFQRHILWFSKGEVLFQPSSEEEIHDNLEKEISRYLVGWLSIQEKIIIRRWGLHGEYGTIAEGDIYSVFKKDNLSSVMAELDHLFAIKRLVIRHKNAKVHTLMRKEPEGEQQITTLKMLEPLFKKPLKKRKNVILWFRFLIYKTRQNQKGWKLIQGDFLRSIDLLDNLLFFYNSRFGLEIPNVMLIEEILTDLHSLFTEGHIKRYILNQQPITAVSKNLPLDLSERKKLLLQMLPVIASRYQ